MMFCIKKIANNLVKLSAVNGPLKMNVNSMSTQTDKRRLNGKVAIVTASSDGIGFSIAKRLAEDGANVVISSRKEKRVSEAVESIKSKGLSVSGTVCHIGKDDDRKKLVNFALEKYGGIDILVSNAAVSPSMGHVLDTPEEAWDKIFDINVKAAFMITKEVVPHIEKRKGGSIVYISSIGGYQPFSLIAAYSVSKTALLGLTKAVALQCAPMNIRVNCVCPGVIQTKFSEPLWNNSDAQEELYRHVPMRRIGQSDEVAGAVSFLVSEDASYMTAESIAVAGGYFSRL